MRAVSFREGIFPTTLRSSAARIASRRCLVEIRGPVTSEGKGGGEMVWDLRLNECEQLSHEKRAPGWLGYIGDEILPSYIGIIISHYKYYKDPY